MNEKYYFTKTNPGKPAVLYLFKNCMNWSKLISSTISDISTISISFGKQPRALMAVPSSCVGIEPSPSLMRVPSFHIFDNIHIPHLIKQVKYLLRLFDVDQTFIILLVEGIQCARSDVENLFQVHFLLECCRHVGSQDSGLHWSADRLLIISKLL